MHISWINCINSGLSAYFFDKIHMQILTFISLIIVVKKVEKLKSL